MTKPVPGSPSDNDTLQNVLDGFAADGFDGEADALDGGIVHWRRCGHDTPAGEVDHTQVRRMEGASDPADMLAVYGITCRVCGDKATLVLTYGPEATPADADVLLALPD